MGNAVESLSHSSADAGSRGTALATDARPSPAVTAADQRIADASRGTGGESTADFLGYFSIGLGLAEALAPTLMSRLVGIKHPDDRNRTIMRLMGLREIGHGLAILSNQQPEKSVWARVGGDALDLALLGGVLANEENDRGRTMFAIMNVLAVAALDVSVARQLSMQPETAAHATAERGVVRTRRSITVHKPIGEVYALWRDAAQLPRFMRHLESVEVLDERRARWTAKAPAGKTVSWEAEIVDDVPDERIAWRSLPGGDVDNSGVVELRTAPDGRATEVRLTLEYDPPFGKLGSKIAMLWREEPGQQAQDSLRHFKQVMELGEVVLSDATKQRGPHPAQPDDAPVEL